MITLWIARDDDDSLWLYLTKPIREKRMFLGKTWRPVDKHEFPEVTFENSPMEVELVIKK